MGSAGVTLCSPSDMRHPLPQESDKGQNWYSFYKNKFGFLGLACVLLWTLARLLAVAMFGIAAPPLVRQENAWGGD